MPEPPGAAVFAALGYSYILQPSIQILREQIAHPDQPLLDVFSVYVPASESKLRGIYVADEPIPSLMVRMGYHLIILPSWDSPDDVYEQLTAGQPPGGGPFHASFVGEILWPTRMEFAFDLP